MKKTKKRGRQVSPDDQLKNLYDAGQIGNFWDEHQGPFQTFGDLIFEGAAYSAFAAAIEALHKTDAAISKTVSKADFTKAVVARLRPLYDLSQRPILRRHVEVNLG